MRIAVLALQGAFIEHEKMLAQLGVECFEVRGSEDWCQPKDALISPGGESTTMLKLLTELQLLEPIRESIEKGLPVFGTCAGLILLARKVEGDDVQRISTMNITVCRNAYGRQMGSFFIDGKIEGVAHPVPMTFIRAPYIASVGNGVEVLAEVSGRIVAARQDKQLVTAFHPELNNDTSIHELFLNMVGEKS